jgi:XTP/dITP diphosphohydrolase
MRKIVLATKNTGKITEFKRLLDEHAKDIAVLGLNDFPDMPDVVESGKSLSENARLKAKEISDFTHLPALADDSGLFIDALNGDPGIYSARWGGYLGEDSSQRDLVNINKVLGQLKTVSKDQRGAQFKAVVALYKPNLTGPATQKEFEGILPGEIVFEPIGNSGFGYDPIFMPSGFNQSLAELSPRVKGEISHRGIALRMMAPFLLANL